MGKEERQADKDAKATRRLQFTSEHKVLFRLLLDAFITRGSQRDRRVTPEDKRSEARILRALKSVSDPVGQEPAEGELDARERRLMDDGGTIELQGADFKRLQRYVEQAQTPCALADVADDLEQLLNHADKIDPGAS